MSILLNLKKAENWIFLKTKTIFYHGKQAEMGSALFELNDQTYRFTTCTSLF